MNWILNSLFSIEMTLPNHISEHLYSDILWLYCSNRFFIYKEWPFFVIVFSTVSGAQTVYCHQASWLTLDLYLVFCWNLDGIQTTLSEVFPCFSCLARPMPRWYLRIGYSCPLSHFSINLSSPSLGAIVWASGSIVEWQDSELIIRKDVGGSAQARNQGKSQKLQDTFVKLCWFVDWIFG
jgi:hypothetical protein